MWTCGRACITVSSNALIPVANFKSFSTVEIYTQYESQSAFLLWYITMLIMLWIRVPKVLVCARIETFAESEEAGIKIPRAILKTLMIRMIVGLIGRAAFILISSSVMPMMERSTMARSNWFHLSGRAQCLQLQGHIACTEHRTIRHYTEKQH